VSVLGLRLITFIDAIMMNSQPLIGTKVTGSRSLMRAQ
jgi:hypothetical protein